MSTNQQYSTNKPVSVFLFNRNAALCFKYLIISILTKGSDFMQIRYENE